MAKQQPKQPPPPRPSTTTTATSSSSTKSQSQPKQDAAKMVHSFHDKNRADLDYLRAYLLLQRQAPKPKAATATLKGTTPADYMRTYLQPKQKPNKQETAPTSITAPVKQNISTGTTDKDSSNLASPVIITENGSSTTTINMKMKKEPVPRSSWRLVFLRSVVMDVPLLLLVSSLALTFLVRQIWTTYYVPLMERAQRTDVQLLDEYTYYERTCSEVDITSGFAQAQQPLLQRMQEISSLRTPHHIVSSSSLSLNTTATAAIISLSEAATIAETALDSLMTHGAVLVPQLLSSKTIRKLRGFLKHKNRSVKDEEAFPMSQGYQRLSYGLEATEDEAIIMALHEITSHLYLKQLLQKVVGHVDPALTEITAITAYYGAEHQVLHSDTKSDGYATQFARSYSHSYSLFIPVQPVSARMGVTQLCPGTHYCTNDMEDVCIPNLMGVHQAYDDDTPIWKAGDGMLLNQQAWHGGSAHTDPQNPERILFILSFIAPPKLGTDTRQLARGTYFHMKWNMWGHTWSDIAKDSAMSTSWPFCVLRSLALWKPRDRKSWGYDLLLSAALRAANGQLGMEAGDLHTFIQLKMNRLFHYPKWLQGRFLPQSDHPWQIYIQETLDNSWFFWKIVNATFLATYLLLGLVVTIASACSSASPSSSQPSGVVNMFGLMSVLKRLVLMHGSMALLTWLCLRRVETSEWGSNISSGKTMMRPFPVDTEFTSARWETDPTLPKGRTTLPGRMDVLWGTRYDAKYLGSYNRWLEYHPGNRVLSAAVRTRAHLYTMYDDDVSMFVQALIQDVMNEVADQTNNTVRFLKQDHLSGDWVILSDSESLEMVRLALATASDPLLKAMHQEINYLVANYRFGHHRGTALALESTLYLEKLSRQLLGSSSVEKRVTTTGSSNNALAKPLCSVCLRPSSLNLEPIKTAPKSIPRPTTIPSSTATPSLQEITTGTSVMVFMSLAGTWNKGIVGQVLVPNQTFDISFDDGSFEENVSIRRLRKPVLHLEEGVRVRAYTDDVPYEGNISMVYPTGNVDIVFDDADFATSVAREDYDIIYPAFSTN